LPRQLSQLPRWRKPSSKTPAIVRSSTPTQIVRTSDRATHTPRRLLSQQLVERLCHDGASSTASQASASSPPRRGQIARTNARCILAIAIASESERVQHPWRLVSGGSGLAHRGTYDAGTDRPISHSNSDLSPKIDEPPTFAASRDLASN
jgi:hypothetical protein